VRYHLLLFSDMDVCMHVCVCVCVWMDGWMNACVPVRTHVYSFVNATRMLKGHFSHPQRADN